MDSNDENAIKYESCDKMSSNYTAPLKQRKQRKF